MATTQTTINTERVKLATTRQEREHYDTLAELYSVIYATEKLEKAFIRDSISQDEYVKQCLLLIQKFKSLRNMVNMSMEDFMTTYKLNCPAAKHRLLIMGTPEITKVNTNGGSGGGSGGGGSGIGGGGASTKVVAECTQHFITLMDALEMNLHSMDQIHPRLSLVINSLDTIFCSIPEIDRKYPERKTLVSWLTTLNNMKAHEELDESQARQLSFDLDKAYKKFYQVLE